MPIVASPLHGDVDARGLRSAELDGVLDQVLEELHELRIVSHDGRERVVCYRGAALAYGHQQVVERPVEHGLAIDRSKRFPPRARAGVDQKVVD